MIANVQVLEIALRQMLELKAHTWWRLERQSELGNLRRANWS